MLFSNFYAEIPLGNAGSESRKKSNLLFPVAIVSLGVNLALDFNLLSQIPLKYHATEISLVVNGFVISSVEITHIIPGFRG